MSVLLVADPLASLDPAIDASIGLADAAQRQGQAIWCCEPEDLSVRAGRVHARARRIVLAPRHRVTGTGGVVQRADHRWLVEPAWHQVVERAELDVAAETDLVLLRIDPPVDARYLHATHLLDLVHEAGTRVVNRPEGIRAVHEKLVALRFPDLCPATLVTADPARVLGFLAGRGCAVVKPLDGFGGLDVWLLRDDASARALAESATGNGRRQVIVQEYLPDVATGNKRLFVLDGEIIGAVLRRPGAEDFRIGPPCAPADVEPADQEIVATIAPLLARHGIVLAGLDVIGGRLIEVNVTCPGGMHKTDALLGTDLSGAIVRRLLPGATTHHEETKAKVRS